MSQRNETSQMGMIQTEEGREMGFLDKEHNSEMRAPRHEYIG